MEMRKLNKLCTEMLAKGQYEAEVEGVKIKIKKVECPQIHKNMR